MGGWYKVVYKVPLQSMGIEAHFRTDLEVRVTSPANNSGLCFSSFWRGLRRIEAVV